MSGIPKSDQILGKFLKARSFETKPIKHEIPKSYQTSPSLYSVSLTIRAYYKQPIQPVYEVQEQVECGVFNNGLLYAMKLEYVGNKRLFFNTPL